MLSRASSFSGPFSNLFKVGDLVSFTISGLILRYEMRGTQSYLGTSSVNDLVGNSNGTLYNGTTYSSNGYLNLDGSDDYLITNTSLNSKLSPTNTSTLISYFGWFYPMDNGVLVTEQGSSSLNSSWHDSQIEMVSGALEFGVWNGLGSTSFISSISTPLNNWYYLGLTYDGTTLRGYVNSQLAGSVAVSRATPYNNGGSVGLHYGLGATDFTNLGDGTYAKTKLGAFHVYNKALSQKEVSNNYSVTKSNYIYTSNMLIWIDANDTQSFSGGKINDISGNYFTHSFGSGATSSNLYGVRTFNCNSASNSFLRVDGTGPTLSTSGYTYTTWARITSISTAYRTLFRSAPNDHALLVDINTDNLGFYDNDTASFKDSGYDVTTIEDKWVQYSVVGDSSSSIFYINDTQVGSVSFGAGGNKHDYFGGLTGQQFGYLGNMMLYNTKLTIDQIKQNYDALKHVYEQSNFVTNNLKLYFNPSNLLSYPGSGSTINDLSGNSLNGTLSNVTFISPYFDFNGSNSQISISDNANIEPGSGNWTMEVWFRSDIISGAQVILGKFDSGGLAADVSYSIRTNGSILYSQIGTGLGNTLNVHYANSTNYSISINTWYHATYVYSNSGDTFTTYINGLSIGTVSCTIGNLLDTTNNLYIGSYNNGEYSQYFNGQVGIVRLYNSVLSASDVSQNFNTNKSLYGL